MGGLQVRDMIKTFPLPSYTQNQGTESAETHAGHKLRAPSVPGGAALLASFIHSLVRSAAKAFQWRSETKLVLPC